jgi:hypothetical protein
LDIEFRTASDLLTACGSALRLLITEQADAVSDTRRGAALGWIEFVEHERPAHAIGVSARTARKVIGDGR